jgi:hypothetical protein
MPKSNLHKMIKENYSLIRFYLLCGISLECPFTSNPPQRVWKCIQMFVSITNKIASIFLAILQEVTSNLYSPPKLGLTFCGKFTNMKCQRYPCCVLFSYRTIKQNNVNSYDNETIKKKNCIEIIFILFIL